MMSFSKQQRVLYLNFSVLIGKAKHLTLHPGGKWMFNAFHTFHQLSQVWIVTKD